jgi:ABC-type lipoprotein release transport system permease subunit
MGATFLGTLRSFEKKKKKKIKINCWRCCNGYFFLVIERENQMGLAFFLIFLSLFLFSFSFLRRVWCDWQILFVLSRDRGIKESHLRF